MFRHILLRILCCGTVFVCPVAVGADSSDEAWEELESKIKLAQEWESFKKSVENEIYLGELPNVGRHSLPFREYFKGRQKNRWSAQAHEQLALAKR